MAQRTVSIPQRNAFAGQALLYEALSRLTAGVNTALTLPTMNSSATKAGARITLTNPVMRLIGPGTVRTINPVDFGVPIFLIASPVDVDLGTGGNIGSAVTIKAGTAVVLIPETATGIWWPVGGA